MITSFIVYVAGREIIENFYLVKYRKTLSKKSKSFVGPNWVLAYYTFHGFAYVVFGIVFWNYISYARTPSDSTMYQTAQMWMYIIAIHLINSFRKRLDEKYLLDNEVNNTNTAG